MSWVSKEFKEFTIDYAHLDKQITIDGPGDDYWDSLQISVEHGNCDHSCIEEQVVLMVELLNRHGDEFLDIIKQHRTRK